MADEFLPYGRQDINDADIAAVVDVLKSDFLTTGPRVEEFEQAFANYVDAPFAVAVANGTAALHLACLALGVREGDVVLAPTMSFAASANGAAYCGAEIEFMDCDPDTGLVRVEDFISAVERTEVNGKKPKLAVVVHLNGEHADMAALHREASARSIDLIEDACHALGTTFQDEKFDAFCKVGACTYSKMSCYSTHPVKTITTGEGGVITTADQELAKRLRLLRNHGLTRNPVDFEQSQLAFDCDANANPWYYELQELGFNYRLTDIACALGTSQMQRMPQIAERRRLLKQTYDDLFATSNLPVKPVSTRPGVDPVRHLYPILVDFDGLGMERAQFCNALRERGIGTQVHYIPIHLQPYYRSKKPNLSLHGADEYYRKVVSLPLFPTMKEKDPHRVVEAIGEVIASLG